MRVLHVGWGFQPWSWGGLIEHVEDLMEIQARKGYEVSYFCTGRHYPFFRKPKLIRRQHQGIQVYEIINAPIHHAIEYGIVDPTLDLEEPISENFFKEVLNQTKPDLVHLQSWLGLPSSLIEIAARFGIPQILTFQDYFAFCPTVKLFDYAHRLCTDHDVGSTCTICCEKASKIKTLETNTLIYELRFLGSYQWLNWFDAFWGRSPLAKGKSRDENLGSHKNLEEGSPPDKGIRANLFQKRREINLERLKKIDLMIAPSLGVEKMVRNFLPGHDRIRTLSLTVRHLAEIKPRPMKEIRLPIQFGTLNGCSSIAKGAPLIYNAIKILNRKGLGLSFRFHIFGHIPRGLWDECLGVKNVVYHGSYRPNELNRLLNTIDVGIVPSIWEELYGYVGIEFLAKGIPIIGNNRGGIPEYTIEGLTGWLNQSASSEELADLMARIIAAPKEILTLNEKIVNQRARWVKTMDQIFAEMDGIYHQVLQSGPGRKSWRMTPSSASSS